MIRKDLEEGQYNPFQFLIDKLEDAKGYLLWKIKGNYYKVFLMIKNGKLGKGLKWFFIGEVERAHDYKICEDTYQPYMIQMNNQEWTVMLNLPIGHLNSRREA